MRSDRVIVLKFGGSVLRDEQSLRIAVHEIYRWRRQGHRVVAVVSALAGQTNELLSRCRAICHSASEASVAAVVAGGENQAAALLGLYLDRAGVSASVLTPAAIGLSARGAVLDADPVGLDTAKVYAALERFGVVVLPGYIACDGHGQSVLLGRGGSDLTALFCAHQIRATGCRLIKDVDGLYEYDPARPGPRPRRYASASWDNALDTDGSIVQRKAVEFARRRNLTFELGRAGGSRATRIGPGPTSYSLPDRAAPLRVVLLGLGTVGAGVFELLQGMPELFDVVSIAVRDVHKPRATTPQRDLLTTDALACAACDADVVIELMGGLEPAASAIETALAYGAHVVTANKAVLASCKGRLSRAAAGHGRRLLYSAAAGGSMPLLERARDVESGRIDRIRAVVNGTTNYVLDQIAAGATLATAVRDAQRLGFAEQDPSRDLGGLDAAEKLCVLSRTLGIDIAVDDIQRDELSEEAVRALSVRAGQAVRHVATLHIDESPSAAVRLAALDPGDPLVGVKAEHNAALIHYTDGRCELLRGRGAGRWPTAEAVVADLLELSRSATGRRVRRQNQREFARHHATATG